MAKWALNDAYINEIARHGLWPSRKMLNNIRDSTEIRFSNNDVTSLMKGGAVKRELVLLFCQIWQGGFNRQIGTQLASRLPLDLRAILQNSDEVILATIAHELTEDSDYTFEGYEGTARWIESTRSSAHPRFASSHTDCLKVADQIYRTIYFHRTQSLADGDERDSVAGNHIGCSKVEYASTLERWCKTQQFSVGLALQKNKHVGSSIVLSLSDAAYDEVKNGKFPHLELSESHLKPGTGNLFIQAMSDARLFPGFLNRALISKQLVRTCMRQLAFLSPPITGANIRILSFAGSSENKKRLAAWQFKALGTYLADSPNRLEMMELAPEFKNASLWILTGCIRFIQDSH